MRTSALVISALAFTTLSLTACSKAPPAATAELVAAADAEEILESTPWLDSAPRTERDVINAYVFQDGQGLYFMGNQYKQLIELFTYDVDDDRLKLDFLDERKKYKTSYKIERHRGEIFDYKLTIKKSPRGPSVYYGFASDHALPDAVRAIAPLATRP